jgi:hypothetical protein
LPEREFSEEGCDETARVNFSSLFTFCSQFLTICLDYRDIFVTGEHSGNDRMLGDLLNLSRVQRRPDRTGDSLLAKQVLSQLSYTPTVTA